MRIFLGLIAVALVAGCAKEPESVATVGAGGVQAETLFTHEGCRVYRFSDNGRYVYYTNCSGSAKWAENCGKNCIRNVNVPTYRQEN